MSVYAWDRQIKRVGHLFQRRYKAILVEKDAYCKKLSRYIHLNPGRAGLADKASEYPWSSYAYYVGKQKTPAWLQTDFVLGYFGDNASKARLRFATGTSEVQVVFHVFDAATNPLDRLISGNYSKILLEIQGFLIQNTVFTPLLCLAVETKHYQDFRCCQRNLQEDQKN